MERHCNVCSTTIAAAYLLNSHGSHFCAPQNSKRDTILDKPGMRYPPALHCIGCISMISLATIIFLTCPNRLGNCTTVQHVATRCCSLKGWLMCPSASMPSNAQGTAWCTMSFLNDRTVAVERAVSVQSVSAWQIVCGRSTALLHAHQTVA